MRAKDRVKYHLNIAHGRQSLGACGKQLGAFVQLPVWLMLLDKVKCRSCAKRAGRLQ